MFRKFILVSAAALLTTAGVVGYMRADTGGKSAGSSMMATHAGEHRTSPFRGGKANTGYAIHWEENGKSMLKVSDDFVIPDTPAPSWQVVDSRGNTYLLNQMKIKSGTNRMIIVPAYIPDIAKVQCWCSWAEVLLGEASFEQPAK